MFPCQSVASLTILFGSLALNEAVLINRARKSKKLPDNTSHAMTAATIILLRHGTTPANLKKKFAGRTEESLHSLGVAEIERVGSLLAPYSIAKIVTGSLSRTIETGTILRRRLMVGATIDRRLDEISIPHWDGLSKIDIRQRFGRQYPTWLDEPGNFKVAGCETIAEVQRRAAACTEEIFSSYPGQNVLLVSHLIVIRSLVLFYGQMGLHLFRTVEVPNGSLCKLKRNSDGTTTVTVGE